MDSANAPTLTVTASVPDANLLLGKVIGTMKPVFQDFTTLVMELIVTRVGISKSQAAWMMYLMSVDTGLVQLRLRIAW